MNRLYNVVVPIKDVHSIRIKDVNGKNLSVKLCIASLLLFMVMYAPTISPVIQMKRPVL